HARAICGPPTRPTRATGIDDGPQAQSIVVYFVPTFLSRDGFFGSGEDLRVPAHPQVVARMLSDIHHPPEDENDVLDTGNVATHGPMSGWVPAPSASRVSNASTTMVGHIEGH